VINYTRIFEKIGETLETIAESLEKFERYRTLFASSGPLQDSVKLLYQDIAQFTIQATRFYASSRISISRDSISRGAPADYDFKKPFFGVSGPIMTQNLVRSLQTFTGTNSLSKSSLG
jgi:hypothetical protein